jgi:large subunit ribosomal protein L15
MKLEALAPVEGAKKKRKRVGRGRGSGYGLTAGKGTKGQKARSGASIPPWFEGGQMPLQRRIPKRGFTNIFKKCYNVINLEDLKRFPQDSDIGPSEFKKSGLIKKMHDGVKLLAKGEITYPLVIKVHKASAAAINKVEAVGGRVELIPPHKRN